MPKEKSILSEANDVVQEEYNTRYFFNSLDRINRAWLFSICKVIDKRLEKMKDDLFII